MPLNPPPATTESRARADTPTHTRAHNPWTLFLAAFVVLLLATPLPFFPLPTTKAHNHHHVPPDHFLSDRHFPSASPFTLSNQLVTTSCNPFHCRQPLVSNGHNDVCLHAQAALCLLPCLFFCMNAWETSPDLTLVFPHSHTHTRSRTLALAHSLSFV